MFGRSWGKGLTAGNTRSLFVDQHFGGGARVGQPTNQRDVVARAVARELPVRTHAYAAQDGGVVQPIAGNGDITQLQRFWLDLDASEREMPEIALPATEKLLELGGSATQARAWLLPVWEHLIDQPGPRTEQFLPRLVQVLESSLTQLDSTWLARCEAAAKANPREPRLQYLAGMACVQHQLWGKALQLLSQAAPRLNEPLLRSRAWQRLALMAEHRGDEPAAAQAWKQAALAVAVLPDNPAQDE